MIQEERRSTPLRKKAMLEALEKTYGIVTKACKIVGIGRPQHYEWMKNDEDYRTAVEELDNVAIDHSESKLHELIEGVWMEGKEDEDGNVEVYKQPPNVAAIIFHLKCRAKKRGYTEKETTTNEDREMIQPPNVNFISVDMSNNGSTT
jgi:hypothetical protein